MTEFVVSCILGGFSLSLFLYFTGYGLRLVDLFTKWR